MKKLNCGDNSSVRFWSRITKTDKCWVWKGSVNGCGYGKMMLEGKIHLAHRISWKFHHGKWPKLCVCHHCDNRLCVNPNHLFEGTRADNTRDAFLKGRLASGIRSGRYTKPERTARGVDITRSVLDDDKVRFIRSEYKNIGPFKIAKKLGVNYTCVYKVYKGETWKHVN